MPSPISTPASTGCERAQAHIASVARATAKRSQLVKACTTSRGDSPIIAASHGRRPANPTTDRVISSAQMLSMRQVTT